VRRWQARYFSLRGHYLKYFADARKSEIKGILDLQTAVECYPSKQEGAFVVKFGGVGKGSIKLRAAGDAEARKWMVAFRAFTGQSEAEKDAAGAAAAAAVSGDDEDDDKGGEGEEGEKGGEGEGAEQGAVAGTADGGVVAAALVAEPQGNAEGESSEADAAEQQELAALQSAWQQMDADGTGSITFEQFAAIMRKEQQGAAGSSGGAAAAAAAAAAAPLRAAEAAARTKREAAAAAIAAAREAEKEAARCEAEAVAEAAAAEAELAEMIRKETERVTERRAT
jgi:hypothetical protein